MPNGLSVVLNANTDELMKNPDTRLLVEALMREVLNDARASGARVNDEKRPMEVEAVFGNPLRAARAAAAPSPLLESLYRQLKFLDARRYLS